MPSLREWVTVGVIFAAFACAYLAGRRFRR